MGRRALDGVLRLLRDIVPAQDDAPPGDAALVERFLSTRDEGAFETLLKRHGPMVLAVCRRMLTDAHAVEDAFQVTFLVFLQKAPSLRRRDQLGNWLYGVAYRTALRARSMGARRAAREQCLEQAPEPAGSADTLPYDVRPVIDDEIRRLPNRYRQPIVLCYLEGKSITDAAVALGWPAGTVSGRLARAKERLRNRLTRRGVTLSVSALAAALSASSRAAVPLGLFTATAGAAALLAAHQSVGAPGLAPSVSVLFQGVLKTMFISKLKVMAVCFFCLATAGAGVLAYAKVAGQPQDAQRPERALKGAQTPAANPVATQPAEEGFATTPPLDKDHVKTMLRASNFTDRMKSLLEARHEAAATEFQWRWRRFVEGKEMQSTLIEACLRLLEAERELSDRKADGLTVLKNHLERVREIEKIVKLKLEAGSAAFQDMAEATFYRVQAEIWIERQKGQ